MLSPPSLCNALLTTQNFVLNAMSESESHIAYSWQEGGPFLNWKGEFFKRWVV
ncbi:unnamed protein product, partial [Ceratitis capitata]